MPTEKTRANKSKSNRQHSTQIFEYIIKCGKLYGTYLLFKTSIIRVIQI